MTFRLVRELAADGVSVAVACRVLNVSRSGFYDWSTRPPSARSLADAELTTTILAVHAMSRCSYGAPRVHAELRLGLGIACGRKRVARLMREAEVAGISHRRKRGRHRPAPAPHEDLVQRRFVAHAPNRLWCTDITENPTGTGKVYCAAVMDVFSRQIVGWSIADGIRAELVVDALQMATWRRRPEPGTIVHADRGSLPRFKGSSATGCARRVVQWVMTWVLPVAFIAWVPAAVILDHTAGLGVSPTMAWLAPAVGAVFFGLGYQVWRLMLRWYGSTGS